MQTKHDHIYSAINTVLEEKNEEKKWKKLKNEEVTQIQQSIKKKIIDKFESQLPQYILVKKDGYELPPQFFVFLKNPLLWKNFSEQNKEVIKKFEADKMDTFFENQPEQLEVIGKKDLVEQISSHLIQFYRRPKTGGNRSIVNLELLIWKAIDKYHQDVLDIKDYALELSGVRIIHSITNASYYRQPAWLRWLQQLFGRLPQ